VLVMDDHTPPLQWPVAIVTVVPPRTRSTDSCGDC
jgi:hypothetical protein